jgi:DNA-binding NtrC family response regulator
MRHKQADPAERETVPFAGGRRGGERVLVVLGDRVETHPLPGSGSVSIGRSRDCDVVVPDPSVSRRHLRLHLGPPLRCEDLGSVNPARLRGRRLARGETVDVSVGEVVELGRMLLIVRDAAEQLAADPARHGGAAGHPPSSSRGAVIVVDPAMERIYRLVERVAAGGVPVLILGETGVGKEVVAEALHRYSPRAGRPFVRLNCAALPATLLESELFGHERGAFTGADRAQVGLLESGHGGTVFLDEIGDLPLSLQASLLRVLEDRAVLPVGGRKPRPIDVRWVSATNRDLHAAVEAGTFRRDLFYRLNGVSFTVPPLRERPDEISPLAERFAAEARPGGAPAAISTDAMAALRRHGWPGNVRELRHAVEAAALLAGSGSIELEHLPAHVVRPVAAATPDDASLRGELAAIERRRIEAALAACGGNQSRAAQALGMPRRTLVKRLGEYGLTNRRG